MAPACKGRLAKGIKSLLGKENLPILTSKGRLAELIMIAAYYRNHGGIAGTSSKQIAGVDPEGEIPGPESGSRLCVLSGQAS